jgi:O-antigen ligase
MTGPALVALAIPSIYLLAGMAQTIPLPPSDWRALPGRHLLSVVMDSTGRGERSWPVSLSPQDTRAVLLAMLPPVTLFLLTAALPVRARLFLAVLASAIAAGSALLGVAQLAAGDGTFYPYGLPPFSRFPGLFANFNHQATLLASGFMLVVAIAVERRPRDVPRKMAVVLVLSLLAIGTLITSSRAGLGLLAAAGAAGLLLWVTAAAARSAAGERRSAPRRRLAVIGAGLAAIGLLMFLFAGSYRADLMANRFGEAVDDLRFTFWVNTVHAIRLYDPIGSGLGSFDFVYQSVEPLSQIDGSFVNHAHNDYLEMALELGWVGDALIAATFAWVVWRLVAALRRPVLEPGVALARAGGIVLLLIMAHSIVDYPLRTESIGCLFAFCCALLVNRPEPEQSRRIRSRVRQSARLAVA